MLAVFFFLQVSEMEQYNVYGTGSKCSISGIFDQKMKTSLYIKNNIFHNLLFLCRFISLVD